MIPNRIAVLRGTFDMTTLPIYINPSVANTCYQERTGSPPSTLCATGDVCGSIKNLGTAGGYFRATTDGQRGIYTVSGGLTYILSDGVDDGYDYDGTSQTGVDWVAVALNVTNTGNSFNTILGKGYQTDASSLRWYIGANPFGYQYNSGDIGETADKYVINGAATRNVEAGVGHVVEVTATGSKELNQFWRSSAGTNRQGAGRIYGFVWATAGVPDNGNVTSIRHQLGTLVGLSL